MRLHMGILCKAMPPWWNNLCRPSSPTHWSISPSGQPSAWWTCVHSWSLPSAVGLCHLLWRALGFCFVTRRPLMAFTECSSIVRIAEIVSMSRSSLTSLEVRQAYRRSMLMPRYYNNTGKLGNFSVYFNLRWSSKTWTLNGQMMEKGCERAPCWCIRRLKSTVWVVQR